MNKLVVAILVGVISCPTGAVAAAPAPMCHFVVATDAPNPTAIYIHEQAHCWGWWHPEHVGPRSKGYRAYMPHGKYLKTYPRKRLVVQFELMRDVPAICGADEQYGCQWGGYSR